MRSDEDIKSNFKDHVAKLTKVSDSISTLDWRKPGTCFYSVRYVMDGRNLYVTGDLGSAVFNLTWTATLESFRDVNVEYFHEKLAAVEGENMEFDDDTAKDTLQDFFDEYDEDNNYEELLETLKKAVDGCQSNRDWADIVNGELHDDIADFDTDYWEWIYEVGEVVPSRVRAYLIGLKMAAEQLEVK